MMNPFVSLFERRDSLENPSTSLWNALTGSEGPTSAGVSLSDEKAADVPDVFSCIQVLTQDTAKCPIKLRRKREDGRHEDADGHPLWEILHDLPNPETTAYEFKAVMQRNLLKFSRAYAEIVRNQNGEITQLWPLDPRAMKVDRDELNRKRYVYTAPGMRAITWLFNPDRPPLLELTHESPIARCRDLIGLAAALELFGSSFFANGARVSGVLVPQAGAVLNDEARVRLKDAFSKFYGGAKNAHKVVLLESGVDFKTVVSGNNEAQFNETRMLVRAMIAGIFRVPPHKIGDLSRATFSNIEAQGIDYVTDALDPLFVAWEQAIKRDCLTTKQFPRYEAVFDRAALIKADTGSLYQALHTARQGGWMSANDIRRKLNENPISAADGGDVYLVNGNMLPVAATGSDAPEGAEQDAGL